MIQDLPTTPKNFPHRTDMGLGLGLLWEFFPSVVSVCAMSLYSAKVNNFQALDCLNMFGATDPPGIPMSQTTRTHHITV